MEPRRWAGRSSNSTPPRWPGRFQPPKPANSILRWLSGAAFCAAAGAGRAKKDTAMSEPLTDQTRCSWRFMRGAPIQPGGAVGPGPGQLLPPRELRGLVGHGEREVMGLPRPDPRHGLPRRGALEVGHHRARGTLAHAPVPVQRAGVVEVAGALD